MIIPAILERWVFWCRHGAGCIWHRDDEGRGVFAVIVGFGINRRADNPADQDIARGDAINVAGDTAMRYPAIIGGAIKHQVIIRSPDLMSAGDGNIFRKPLVLDDA